MATPSITIIVPTHNGYQDTKRCLISIKELTYPNNKISTIVVDNNSTDSTPRKIKKYFPIVKLYILKKNLGFAKAVNIGLKKFKTDYYLIANNDVVFDKNFLSVLIKTMEKNKKIGIAGGKILDIKSYKQRSTDSNKGLRFIGMKFNPWTGAIKQLPFPNKPKETQWVQGCAMLISKKTINTIGLFNPNYFFSFEDLDYCQRAKTAGFIIFYQPKAFSWHIESSTIDRFGLKKKAYELYKAKFYYIFHNSTPLQVVSSILYQFIIIAPIRTFIIKNPPFFLKPMLKGFFHNIRLITKNTS